MTYHYEPTEAAAVRYLARARARGLRGYVLQLRADCFEIRTWR